MHSPYLINILCRTANRPKAFKVFVKSLAEQTYPEKRLIVSADDDKSFKYCRKILSDNFFTVPSEIVRLQRTERNPNKTLRLDGYPVSFLYHAPYNLYENPLADKVDDGYMMYLDDDDKFCRPDSLECIASIISSPDDLIMWKVNVQGRIIPEPDHFGCAPKPTHVSGIGFAFHSKYKDYAVWDEFSCCDYRVIKRLWDAIPNKVYIDSVLTQTQTIGQGNREDIK